jgi:hypothetical protein
MVGVTVGVMVGVTVGVMVGVMAGGDTSKVLRLPFADWGQGERIKRLQDPCPLLIKGKGG